VASPQVKNGHTRIANEILEHLMRLHLSSNQWQVLLCIIRKTYGFHRKVDYIANFQIVEATGLCKTVVSRTLNTLNGMKVIDRKGKHIGFQKDWERWQKLAIPSTFQELAEQSTIDTKLAEQSTIEKLAISTQELAICTTKVSSPAVAQKIKDIVPHPTPPRNPETNSFKVWEDCVGRPITGYEVQQLELLASDYSEQWLCDAIRRAAEQGREKVKINYTKRILERWQAEGKDAPKKDFGWNPRL